MGICDFFFTIPSIQTATINSASLSGFQLYPQDYIWNVPVDTLPLDSLSEAYVHSGNPSAYLYMYPGIPYNIVNKTQPKQYLTSFWYPEYSDNIPYPIPDNPLVETPADHHMLILDKDSNFLYEVYQANQNEDGTWLAGCAVAYDLSDYKLRPDHTISADAAGLPILPGLIRYDEVDSGTINHALRFATNSLQNTYVWPARAAAGSTNSNPSLPPHGQRFRLKVFIRYIRIFSS